MISPYKLLILDYGGVYSFDYDGNCFNEIMLSTFGVVPDSLQKERISEYSKQFGANRIHCSDYVANVAKILQVEEPESTTDFEKLTISFTHPPSTLMQKLVKFVRKNHIAVSLLSDMYKFEAIKTRPWGRYDGFDYVALSSEFGATKQEEEFFNDTLRHFGVLPHEALFVDDNLANIRVASDVGLHVLHADKAIYPDVQHLSNDILSRLKLS